MTKTIISRKVRIKAKKQKVWDALADFGNVYKISSQVLKSHSTSEKKNGVGATRHCDIANMGAQLEERITEWNEGKSMKIDVYKTKNMPMIVNMKAFFSLDEDGDDTVLSGIIEYSMSNFIGDMMNGIFMRKMNIKGWETFLAGIKLHLETGKEILKDTKVDRSTVERS